MSMMPFPLDPSVLASLLASYGGQGATNLGSADSQGASGSGGIQMPSFDFVNPNTYSHGGYTNPGAGGYQGAAPYSTGNPQGQVANALAEMGAGQFFGGGQRNLGTIFPGGQPGIGGYGYSPQQQFNAALAKQLATSYQTNYADAKKANLDRYNQLVGMDTSLRDRGIGTAQQGLTEQEALRQRGMGAWDKYVTGQNSLINQNYNNAKQAEELRLAESGLSNSTVLGSAMHGIDAQRAQQLGLLARDQIGVDTGLTQNVVGGLQNLQGTDTSLTGNLAGVIERRSDPYPNFDEYTRTMMQLGQMGAFGLPQGGYGAPVGGIVQLMATPNVQMNQATGKPMFKNPYFYGGWGSTPAGGGQPPILANGQRAPWPQANWNGFSDTQTN